MKAAKEKASQHRKQQEELGKGFLYKLFTKRFDRDTKPRRFLPTLTDRP